MDELKTKLTQRKLEIEATFNQYSEEYLKTQQRLKELEESLQQLKGMYAEIENTMNLLSEEENS